MAAGLPGRARPPSLWKKARALPAPVVSPSPRARFGLILALFVSFGWRAWKSRPLEPRLGVRVYNIHPTQDSQKLEVLQMGGSWSAKTPSFPLVKSTGFRMTTNQRDCDSGKPITEIDRGFGST